MDDNDVGGKPAREMTLREVVAMFFMLQFAANDETSWQEDAMNAFVAADVFIEESQR
jgi:hypothetical protein